MENWTQLLDKYLAGTLSVAELEVFLSEADQHPEAVQEALSAVLQAAEPLAFGTNEQRERILGRIAEQTAAAEPGRQRRILVFRRLSVAAVFLAAVAAAWLLIPKKARKPSSASPAAIALVQPGSDKATLTLADGTTIVLDSAADGHLSDQQGMRIIKLNNSQLSYQDQVAGNATAAASYNTLATPRGGQYQVILSDGTRVYLNADSKLQYPTRFSGNTRMVKLSGEAYFEVAKDAAKPFLVDVAGKSRVQVLSTSFNINAYSDEPSFTTTLVTGKVKVTYEDAAVADAAILLPGQQAVQAERLAVRTADVEKVLAWKNGIFNFEGVDFKTGMRQLARWYNVELVFEGNGPYNKLSGEMDRGLTIDQVLETLKELNIRCRLEGRRLIVQS